MKNIKNLNNWQDLKGMNQEGYEIQISDSLWFKLEPSKKGFKLTFKRAVLNNQPSYFLQFTNLQSALDFCERQVKKYFKRLIFLSELQVKDIEGIKGEFIAECFDRDIDDFDLFEEIGTVKSLKE